MLGETKQNEDDVGGFCDLSDLFSGSRAPWVLGMKSHSQGLLELRTTN